MTNPSPAIAVVPSAALGIYRAIAPALAPRPTLAVSQRADDHRRLGGKGSAMAGQWVTDNNLPLADPMDCISARSILREAVIMFPIQMGKTEVAINVLGYCMDHNHNHNHDPGPGPGPGPGPVKVCLPGELSMNKWVAQKLNPMINESPAVRRALTSVASRDSANTRTFKDFAGGQLCLEHAGSPSRLKSTTVRTMIVDEVDEFSNNLAGGDDLPGRAPAFHAR